VVYCDPGVPTERGAAFNAVKVSLEELLTLSDFVTLHAPATEATAGMMGAEQFARMRKGSFFLNTARASLVDAGALRASLEAGHLAGAALDVFPVEPPASDDSLVSRPDVIATPHLGGDTVEVAAHQGAIAAEQLRRLLRGERPGCILNPEVLDAFDWTAPRPEPPAGELERLARRPRPSMTS
jgi:autoinducer 2 (AI-2) kinase